MGWSQQNNNNSLLQASLLTVVETESIGEIGRREKCSLILFPSTQMANSSWAALDEDVDLWSNVPTPDLKKARARSKKPSEKEAKPKVRREKKADRQLRLQAEKDKQAEEAFKAEQEAAERKREKTKQRRKERKLAEAEANGTAAGGSGQPRQSLMPKTEFGISKAEQSRLDRERTRKAAEEKKRRAEEQARRDEQRRQEVEAARREAAKQAASSGKGKMSCCGTCLLYVLTFVGATVAGIAADTTLLPMLKPDGREGWEVPACSVAAALVVYLALPFICGQLFGFACCGAAPRLVSAAKSRNKDKNKKTA